MTVSQTQIRQAMKIVTGAMKQARESIGQQTATATEITEEERESSGLSSAGQTIVEATAAECEVSEKLRTVTGPSVSTQKFFFENNGV